MNTALVIHGKVVEGAFVAEEPMPDFEAPAQLIVYPAASPSAAERSGRSMFDYFGKSPHPRSAEELDAQLREERDAWNEP